MKKILAIVDDQDTLRRIQAIIPEVFGHITLYTTSSGSEGLELAGMHEPDVILLDNDLTGESGIEICRALKKSIKLKDIPILFITSPTADYEIRKEALNAGPEVILYKPVDEIVLTAQLKVLIKLESTIREQRREIERRIQLEESLEESGERFIQVTKSSGIWIWEVDAQGKYTWCSESGEAVLGYQAGEIIGKMHFYDFFVPEIREELTEKTFELFAQKESLNNLEHPCLHKDGHFVVLEKSGTPILDPAGNLVGYRGADKDISARILTESELENSIVRLNAILDSTGDGIMVENKDAKITHFNKKMLELWQIPDNYLQSGLDGELLTYAKGNLKYPEQFLQRVKEIHSNDEETSFDVVEFRDGSVLECYSKSLRINIKSVGRVWSFHDITQLMKDEEDLKNKNTFIQTVLDNLPLGIALNQIDSGSALYINKKFVEIYGWPEEEMKDIGSFFYKVYPDENYRNELASRVLNDINSGDPKRMKWDECRITHKDGSVHYINAVNIPLYEQNMMVSTVSDITERQKNRDELIHAKDKAEESNRLKSSFLSNMSHEIRTPMNAISGFSSLLSEANDEEKIEYAEIIQKSSAQLLTLVDDVLLLSRLQSEKLPVIYSQFSPASLVHSVSQLFQIPGQHSNLEFKVTIPEQYSSSLYLADENKVMQVLTCLASNAIKYTPQGCIEIGFNVVNQQIEFYVKDTGIGISKPDQQRIFDTFFRTEQAISLAIRGTGLGLNIAKELVTLMGGQIGVQSAPGQGSRFYFTVPVEQLDLINHTWSNSQVEESTYSDMNILIVDDELINCQLVEVFLRGIVKNIDFAFDGQEAVDKASKEKYDLVLMDIKMPGGMGGLEATMILKNRHPDIKIIAQTAFTLPEEQELAFQAGCDEVLTKPIIKKNLLEKFSKLGF